MTLFYAIRYWFIAHFYWIFLQICLIFALSGSIMVPWLHPPLRSRSLLPLRGNTLSGSVAPSCLPFPPSNRCGSPSKNTTNAAHPLSTENASKLYIFYYCIVFNLLFMLFDPNFIFMFYSNIPKMNKLYVNR